jgi:hypothetical protein
MSDLFAHDLSSSNLSPLSNPIEMFSSAVSVASRIHCILRMSRPQQSQLSVRTVELRQPTNICGLDGGKLVFRVLGLRRWVPWSDGCL